MTSQTLQIAALDSYPLAASLFAGKTSTPGKAVVIISSAIGVPRSYYERFARYLVRRGFSVVTFDYRGIGDSRPERLRNFPARMSDWGSQDLAGVIRWSQRAYPDSPRFVIGHSVGGQIFGLAHNNAAISAVVTVASQMGYWRLWPGLSKYGVAVLWYFVLPLSTRLLGYFPAKRLGLGENLPPEIALDWARWARTPGFVVEYLGEEATRAFRSFDGPILAYSFADDRFAPRRAVSGLMELYSGADRDHRHIAPKDLDRRKIGHFGFFRESFEPTLWQETAEWLAGHV